MKFPNDVLGYFTVYTAEINLEEQCISVIIKQLPSLITPFLSSTSISVSPSHFQILTFSFCDTHKKNQRSLQFVRVRLGLIIEHGTYKSTSPFVELIVHLFL